LSTVTLEEKSDNFHVRSPNHGQASQPASQPANARSLARHPDALQSTHPLMKCIFTLSVLVKRSLHPLLEDKDAVNGRLEPP